MRDTMEAAESGLDLRAQLEELASDLVLSGLGDADAGGIAGQFRRLAERAGSEGYSEAELIASAVAARIASHPGQGIEEKQLEADLSRLRQALETKPEPEAPSELKTQKTEAAAPLSQDPELIGDFVVESREHLESIEGRLLVLEQKPDDMETIHAVFRSFHTIKGLAGFLEFTPIRDVAHEVETLLDLCRNSKLAITPAVVDVVLESADYLKNAIAIVEASLAGEPVSLVPADRNLLRRITQLFETPSAQTAQTELATTPALSAEAVPENSHFPVPAEDPQSAPAASAARNAAHKAPDSSSVRVETAKLDYLMDMVGEMVIAQSLIRHNPSLGAVQDPRLAGDLSQLARITGEVQRTAMDMRMIPIGQLFQRTGRMVRDLSRKAGKRVELETVGEDTELDKTIAEELSDPLLHMVRNSIDHGIEPADARAASGKDPVAKVRLAAFHNGGQIVIEISDDGRGLNREKILNKAIRNGLIDASAHLSDSEVFNLIFEPGFSTAEKITDISGRGVGMDVVRKHVQKLRGRIDIHSKPGQGTTFLLKLPLTLAIIEGLVVKVGPEQYIVPIFAVKELFRPARESLSTIHGKDEMALVRGRLLPVVRLYKQFGVTPKAEDPCDGLLLVAESQEKTFCLLVDELVGKQEVVIKSLGERLKNIEGIAGGAILGNGRVGLILDMDGVFHRRSQ
jgi:two-component system chemotaxis sensor kinase CheA